MCHKFNVKNEQMPQDPDNEQEVFNIYITLYEVADILNHIVITGALVEINDRQSHS
jgi:hypothetical protein